jgi:hypothetical protein
VYCSGIPARNVEGFCRTDFNAPSTYTGSERIYLQFGLPDPTEIITCSKWHPDYRPFRIRVLGTLRGKISSKKIQNLHHISHENRRMNPKQGRRYIKGFCCRRD